MKGSGKTTLLYKLGAIKKNEPTTMIESYDSFKYVINPDQTIYIDKGIDMGGNKNYMVNYDELIAKNDVIFYFFNINKYLTEFDYKRECNSRLAYINSRIKNKDYTLIAPMLINQN